MFENKKVREESLNKAIKLYKDILNTYTKKKFPDRYAEIQNKLGVAYYRILLIHNTPEYKEKALTALNEAAKIYSQDSIKYGEIISNKGLVLKRTAKGEKEILEESIRYFELANEILKDDNYRYGINLRELASAFWNLFDLSKKEKFAKDSIFYAEMSSNLLKKYPFEYAKSQNNLGIAYRKLSDLSEKERNLQKGLFHYSQSMNIFYKKRDWDYATVCNNMGVSLNILFSVNYKEDNVLKGIELFNNALIIHNEKSYPLAFAMTKSNLGFAYLRLSKMKDYKRNIDLSIKNLKESLKYRPKQINKFKYAQSLSLLSKSYIDLSKVKNKTENLTLAKDGLTEVFEISNDGKHDTLLIDCLSRFGHLYYEFSKIEKKEQNLKEAIRSINNSLEIKDDLNKFRYAQNQLELGKIYCGLSSIEEPEVNLDKSEKALNAAKDIFVREGCKYYLMKTNFYTGKLFFQKALFDLENKIDLLNESIKYYNESIKPIQNGNFPLFRAKVLYNMANSYQKLGSDKKSRELYQETSRILKNENVDMDQIMNEKLMQFN